MDPEKNGCAGSPTSHDLTPTRYHSTPILPNPASAPVLHSSPVALQASTVTQCCLRSRLPHKVHASRKVRLSCPLPVAKPFTDATFYEGDG
jgi:hypothetical protein